MSANLTDIIDQIGVGLATLPNVRVFDFPPKSAQAPFAFVDMPESVEYDMSFARGRDRLTVNVYVGVSSQVDRAARDAISLYAASTGTLSVKAALDAATIGSSHRVVSVSFQEIVLGASVFVGAVFQVDVVA